MLTNNFYGEIIMNREECKTILLNSGMDPELLKKPAIKMQVVIFQSFLT